MKDVFAKHRIIRTVHEGIEQVSRIIDQIENKKVHSNYQFFSYDFKSIQISHNVKVSMHGQYIDGGKKAPIGSQRLYLPIQG